MELGRGYIRQKLECRVQGLGRPDTDDCQNNPAPFWLRQPAEEACRNHDHSRRCMDPGVMLRRDHYPDADEGAPDAPDPPRKGQSGFVIHLLFASKLGQTLC